MGCKWENLLFWIFYPLLFNLATVEGKNWYSNLKKYIYLETRKVLMGYHYIVNLENILKALID